MVIAEIVSWWYTKGWHIFIEKVRDFFMSIVNFFSMDSLIRTLFKPFRQISAGSAGSNASLDLRFHMFIDRLVSRAVGFTVRFVLIIVGCILIIIGGIFSLIFIVLWPIIPLAPIAGIILTVMEVTI